MLTSILLVVRRQLTEICLGKGEYGIVYRGTLLAPGVARVASDARGAGGLARTHSGSSQDACPVAVKTLPKHLATRAAARREFFKEIGVARRIQQLGGYVGPQRHCGACMLNAFVACAFNSGRHPVQVGNDGANLYARLPLRPPGGVAGATKLTQSPQKTLPHHQLRQFHSGT